MNTRETKMKLARQLRQEQTEAEAVLWGLLRNRNFENIKFRRQHPLKEYIVDFFSHELRLVIELDDGYHNHPEQKEKDELRDTHLKALGYKVLRYPNAVVLKGQENTICKDILERKNTLSPLLGERGLRILSTKKLKPNQQELILNAGLSYVEYDAITITPVSFKIPKTAKNVIITSQNGAKAFLKEVSAGSSHPKLVEGMVENYFVVGKKTADLLSKNGQKVTKIAQNGAELAHFIAKNHKNDAFHYFCGNRRRAELPTILAAANIALKEIVVYETTLNNTLFKQVFDGVLFYSPSGVDSFFKGHYSNPSLLKERIEVRCFCIGETTAKTARTYSNNISVANSTTVESVIANAVKNLKEIPKSSRPDSYREQSNR